MSRDEVPIEGQRTQASGAGFLIGGLYGKGLIDDEVMTVVWREAMDRYAVDGPWAVECFVGAYVLEFWWSTPDDRKPWGFATDSGPVAAMAAIWEVAQQTRKARDTAAE